MTEEILTGDNIDVIMVDASRPVCVDAHTYDKNNRKEMQSENDAVNENEKFEKSALLESNSNYHVDCEKSSNISSKARHVTITSSSKRKYSIESVHGLQGLKPTTYSETLIHLVKGYIGCGTFTIGIAFKNGGILLSSILLIVIGSIAIYNQYILIVMAEKFKKKHNLDSINFSETIGRGFEAGPYIFKRTANLARNSVKVFIILTQLGVCCVYLLFISQSLKQILACYDITFDLHILMIYVLPFVWLTALIPELKYIVPLSSVANVSMLSGAVLIFYCCIIDLDFKSISERKLIGNWDQIPLCFGTMLYSLEGISLVLPLQQNMVKPKKFLGTFGILNLSLSFVTSIFALLGFFGYYKFGEDVREMLTYNLEARDNLLTQAIILCMVVGILCTYALQFFIPVLLLLPLLNRWTSKWPYQEYNIYEYIFRTLLVLLTFLLAELIPHLDLFTSFIGAVGGSFLALIYSPLADMCRRRKGEYGIFAWRIIIAGISLIIGVFGFVIGSATSVKEIIVAFRNDFLS